MTEHRVAMHQRRVAAPRFKLIRAGAWLTIAFLALALSAPVSAAKPVRGCTNTFDLMTIEGFRERSIEAGVPLDLLGPEWEAGLRARFDRNSDSNICVKDLPDTPGHLDTFVFNVVDNTSNS